MNMNFTEEQKLTAWNKATVVPGFDPHTFRKDACGAWMVWDKYGTSDNIYGWEIDYVIPPCILEHKGFSEQDINESENLRALQFLNKFSKGEDYPSYTSVVTSRGDKNVEEMHNLTVNAKLRAKLEKLYGL